MNKLLVVVDMVNGFINMGKLSDKHINRIVPNVEKLIKDAIKGGDKIVAFVDIHEKMILSFKTTQNIAFVEQKNVNLFQNFRNIKTK